MTSRTFKTACPYCGGVTEEDELKVHIASCPDAPTRPMSVYPTEAIDPR